MAQMQQLQYQVEFPTPAFLGNAEQNGQWRTPPFKALLRQWWRVAVAEEMNYRQDRVRNREAMVFGHAWLKEDRNASGAAVNARKSRVLIRLSQWTTGKETKTAWGEREVGNQAGRVRHPEVRQPIGPLLYLGYGPLKTRKVPRPNGGNDYATVLKNEAAIQAGEKATLSIAASEECAPQIQTALALMGAYGTVGGRSRNGWGSFALHPLSSATSVDLDAARGRSFCRDWRTALALDWPHALGRDKEGPLIWQTTRSHSNWADVMRDLAVCKIALRTAFKFPNQRPPHPKPEPRHWLSYPVTKHRVKSWGGNKRLPNSLRFKVRRDAGDANKLRGIIFHMPCLPPRDFRPDREAIEAVWARVHGLLDANANVRRIGWQLGR